MKIDVSLIVRDHLRTLRDAEGHSISLFDIGVFYLFPISCGAMTYWLKLQFDRDTYNASITFFGIFLALLLNIQVAIFSIYQRKWESLEDDRQAAVQSGKREERRKLLGELNTNISYLTVISCASLMFFLGVYVLKATSHSAAAISVVLYSHFLLTFLMVTKRSHALFQREYRDSP